MPEARFAEQKIRGLTLRPGRGPIFTGKSGASPVTRGKSSPLGLLTKVRRPQSSVLSAYFSLGSLIGPLIGSLIGPFRMIGLSGFPIGIRPGPEL